MKTLKIATRKSPLALWQAEFVARELKKYHPDITIELVKMITTGDKIFNQPLSKVGGKALFIKELEKGMLDGKADIAVHSMKDIPFELPQGFSIGAILKRENPFDAFVSNEYQKFSDMPNGAKIGSCSLRRIVQLKHIRPDIEFIDLRGNVNTRLQKLDDRKYDAIILACAGLIRLGFAERISAIMDNKLCLPAVGQGAIGIEIKDNDKEIKKIINPLVDKKTTICVNAERAMNEQLQGGCQTPIAAFATINNNKIHMSGLVGDVRTNNFIKVSDTDNVSNEIVLGKKIASKLLKLGVDEYL